MTDHPSPRQAMREALAIAAADPQEAIYILSAALTDARQKGSAADITALAQHLGALHQGTGDLEGACRVLTDACLAVPSAHLYLALGTILRDLGREEEALRALENCAKAAALEGDQELVETAKKLLLS